MSGNLVCVGIGMTLGAHICPIAKSYIQEADVVFSGVSNGIVELWIKEMHNDVRSLQQYYSEGKPRTITYKEMVDAMLSEVRAGKKVVGAFYGHPGVFAHAPHKSIELAKAEGFEAKMIPGISAEDCLFADLGIDPGKYGCAQYEASQLMFYQRTIDTCAYLILWQVGIAGDQSLGKFSTTKAYRQVLIDLLAKDYPMEHQVILYEAAVLPIENTRIEKISLADFLNAELSQHTTMVIPPAKKMQSNDAILKRLAELDSTITE
ncbi:SAM-dependent methyltransferase [Thalassomonas sp. RHCl1]|uniref:SAM-dependent methyltransferase n=1 Tax=Thalassomonas sp. RHCl1 TaxID=2995320 RepID=UPI00248AA212|nr:SAM-dependent methyltransferase [Thalassomonas sp. RHCl1]